MNTTVTLLGAVVVLAIVLVARYGADSRRGDDPTGRDPAWPAAPGRDHTLREDLALLTMWARRLAAHRRCWALLDRSLRPWETTGDLRSPTRKRTRTGGAGRGHTHRQHPGLAGRLPGRSGR